MSNLINTIKIESKVCFGFLCYRSNYVINLNTKTRLLCYCSMKCFLDSNPIVTTPKTKSLCPINLQFGREPTIFLALYVFLWLVRQFRWQFSQWLVWDLWRLFAFRSHSSENRYSTYPLRSSNDPIGHFARYPAVDWLNNDESGRLLILNGNNLFNNSILKTHKILAFWQVERLNCVENKRILAIIEISASNLKIGLKSEMTTNNSALKPKRLSYQSASRKNGRPKRKRSVVNADHTCPQSANTQSGNGVNFADLFFMRNTNQFCG